MVLKEEEHRGKVSFLSHHIKRGYKISTWLITGDADLDHLAEIVFIRDHSGFFVVYEC